MTLRTHYFLIFFLLWINCHVKTILKSWASCKTSPSIKGKPPSNNLTHYNNGMRSSKLQLLMGMFQHSAAKTSIAQWLPEPSAIFHLWFIHFSLLPCYFDLPQPNQAPRADGNPNCTGKHKAILKLIVSILRAVYVFKFLTESLLTVWLSLLLFSR